jgi:hypothetical protein
MLILPDVHLSAEYAPCHIVGNDLEPQLKQEVYTSKYSVVGGGGVIALVGLKYAANYDSFRQKATPKEETFVSTLSCHKTTKFLIDWLGLKI